VQYIWQILVTIVTFGGHVIVAATLSHCVITCVQLTGWPAQSVADHVRVITFEQDELGLLSVWLVVTGSTVPQASVAVTTGAVGIWPAHCTVMLGGLRLNVGAAVKIVSLKVAMEVRPQLSVPVTVIVAGQVSPLSLTVKATVPPQLAVPLVAAKAVASAKASEV
jgi:hypothetical protein